MSAARMLTGDRPTGRLHLGHLVGSIANRVRLHQRYESFFIIADLHMLTTRNTREDVERVAHNAREMVTDVLAADGVAGIDLADDQQVEATYPASVLAEASNPDAAAAFLAFLSGDEAQSILEDLGFGLP